jgi:tRNA pseudouridine38-40 synthase
MRIALGIEYDGSRYNGWQTQKHGMGIQSLIEQALSKVADHTIKVICAGRTDTGVHAVEQVVHFDSDADRDMRAWLLGGNANLPADISILWARHVEEDFHARFSALSRSYRYIIFNRDIRPAILADKVSWEYRPLDAGKMQTAAKHLLGQHDFSSYRTVHCQSKTPMRNIMRLDVSRHDDFVIIDIEANAFLHHMVRNIAGVLMTIGAGDAPVDWSRQVLEIRDRTKGGVTAPAAGLYFMSVVYPEQYELPTNKQSADFLSMLKRQ